MIWLSIIQKLWFALCNCWKKNILRWSQICTDLCTIDRFCKSILTIIPLHIFSFLMQKHKRKILGVFRRRSSSSWRKLLDQTIFERAYTFSLTHIFSRWIAFLPIFSSPSQCLKCQILTGYLVLGEFLFTFLWKFFHC